MAATTLGVKLDAQVRARLKAAAEQQGRTTHWLVKQVILSGLERLERGEAVLARDNTTTDEPSEPAEEAASPVPFLDLAQDVQPQTVLRAAVTSAYRRPEPECLPLLLTQAELPSAAMQTVRGHAQDLVRALRAKGTHGLVESLLQEYALSSQEGVALMCLAEALLRIPDSATRDALIRDKIGNADWQSHLGGSHPLFVHAATWGLLLTGRLAATASETGLSATLAKLIARGGEPLIRRGMNIAMRLMGEQFVVGQTIGEALANSRRLEARGFRYSYDMLGEAAMTGADAARYYRDYEQAVHAIGKASSRRGIYEGPGISVKLSALHPRYARAQRDRVMQELLPRLSALVSLARNYDVSINIDAEEVDRLEISLDLLEALCFQPSLDGWNGIGFVVQAYQKRTPFVIDYLIDLARRSRHRLMVRLVKGAYWDSEIKHAQVDGLEGFPVFTRKVHTDVCYLACARSLLGAAGTIFPQFATHNAQTLAAVYVMAGENFYPGQYEFQCLHGMGEPLYEEVVGPRKLNRPCRIYAPVGTHETLLPYLVRRLLENGSNTSFVNKIANRQVPVEELTADPVEEARAVEPPGSPHPKIAAPRDIFGSARANSAGFDLTNEQRLASLASAALASLGTAWQAVPILARAEGEGTARDLINPADRRDRVGTVVEATPDVVDAAFGGALEAAPIWQATPPEDRAAALRRAADLLETRTPTLVSLIVREAGKTLPSAIGEVREAVDFLRYYSGEILRDFDNHSHRPLGPVVAISPWNFPLSIFTGQIAGALAAGNVVLAKPAEETPLIAAATVRLLHEAGVPRGALQLIHGDGTIGAALVADPRVRGVIFTGSTEVARSIQRSLADRLDPRGGQIALIAETGGQNAMVVDSSALPEQAVADIIASGFDSAGQRCSSLRILLVQDEIAEHLIEMLRGAMRELRVGRPDRLDTDIGPVITAEASVTILRHIEAMRSQGFTVFSSELSPDCAEGTFVAPTLIEIPDPSVLGREVFGPVVHVVRYRRSELDAMIDKVNALGYGLTFGIHSRVDETIAHVTERINAGNIYVNRNIIGAVVGVQPFGGHGLSGTGPKAGGPLYVRRMLVERPAASGLPRGTVPVAFRSFLAFLEADDDGCDVAALAAFGETSPHDLRLEMPGPVGEQNTYRLIPRGAVLCVAATRAGEMRQIAAALATGNRALVSCEEDLSALDRLPDALKHHIARAEADDSQPLGAALFEGDAGALQLLSARLAERAGTVVPVFASPREEGATAFYPLEYLLAEQTISVNTTAAGGNASLMTIG